MASIHGCIDHGGQRWKCIRMQDFAVAISNFSLGDSDKLGLLLRKGRPPLAPSPSTAFSRAQRCAVPFQFLRPSVPCLKVRIELKSVLSAGKRFETFTILSILSPKWRCIVPHCQNDGDEFVATRHLFGMQRHLGYVVWMNRQRWLIGFQMLPTCSGSGV